MSFSKIKALVLVGFLILPSTHQLQARCSNEITPAKIIIGSGIIAAGIYWLASWLRPSDAQVYDECSLVFHDAQRNYGALLQTLEMTIGTSLDQLAIRERQGVIKNFPEDVLSTLISEYDTINVSEIDRWVGKLTRAKVQLNERISGCKAIILREHMQSLTIELDVLMQKLLFLRDFCKQHASYFELSKAERALIKFCGKSLYILKSYAHDSANLAHKLRMHIIQVSNAHYPYTTYIGSLESAINRVEAALNDVQYSYPLLSANAQTILAQAQYMRTIIITDPAYTQEKHHRHMVELEQERNRALQRQAQAQEQQARAQTNQAYAQERQAQALEQQAYAQVRQAKADEEQLRIARQLLGDEEPQQIIIVV